MAYQVLVGEVGDVARLDAEVLEGLRVLVNDLVVELALNLVGGAEGPPQSPVQDTKKGLHHGFGQVDVTALLDDLTVDKLRNLLHAVLLGAVELEGLAGGRVVVADLLECLTDVDDVDGEEALGHVVCGEDVGRSGQTVQKTVLEAEHGRRPDDGGLREDLTGDALGVVLRLEELGRVFRMHGVRRDVDEAVDVVLGHGGGNAVGALDMDVLEVEVLGGVVAASKVEDHVGVAHALLNAVGVAQVVLSENDAAEVTGDLKMALAHLLAEGHHDGTSCASESVHDISSQEPSGTEDGGCVATQRAATAGDANNRLAGACDGNVLEVAAGLDGEGRGGLGQAGEQPGRRAEDHIGGVWRSGEVLSEVNGPCELAGDLRRRSSCFVSGVCKAEVVVLCRAAEA